jgi:hypothetical protein
LVQARRFTFRATVFFVAAFAFFFAFAISISVQKNFIAGFRYQNVPGSRAITLGIDDL